MEDILKHKLDGHISVYSPDSDMIILTSILLNMIPKNINVYVIRYDQQIKVFDIAYVNAFANNIVEYVIKNLKLSKSSVPIPTNKNIIDDIMFIFTLFGNDFVHRIESIDAKRDSDILMDTYLQTIINRKGCIVLKGTLNLTAIAYFFEKISFHEPYLLCDTYLFKNYKNYKYLRSIFMDNFWYGTLHLTLIIYFKISNIIFKYIENKNVKDIKKLESKIRPVLDTHNCDMFRYEFCDILRVFMILEFNIDIEELDGHFDMKNLFM
mgnify:CR=1 FL=1